jgi:hypothetical protein
LLNFKDTALAFRGRICTVTEERIRTVKEAQAPSSLLSLRPFGFKRKISAALGNKHSKTLSCRE